MLNDLGYIYLILKTFFKIFSRAFFHGTLTYRYSVDLVLNVDKYFWLFDVYLNIKKRVFFFLKPLPMSHKIYHQCIT